MNVEVWKWNRTESHEHIAVNYVKSMAELTGRVSKKRSI